MAESIIQNYIGFEWNDGNLSKNWDKHKVSTSECEQIFFNVPLLIYDDEKHSNEEKRVYALGKTDAERLLFVVFTVINNLIRVISARDMSKNERKIYENEETA